MLLGINSYSCLSEGAIIPIESYRESEFIICTVITFKNLDDLSIIVIVVLVTLIVTILVQLPVQDWNIANTFRHLWNLLVGIGIDHEVQVSTSCGWGVVEGLELIFWVVISIEPRCVVALALPIVPDLVRVEASSIHELFHWYNKETMRISCI